MANGPLRASACLQPVILVLAVAALRPGGADRGLNGLEVDVTLAGHREILLSSALVIAGTDSSPRGQASGVAEHGHVDADLRDDRQRDPVIDAGDLPDSAARGRAGPSPQCARQGSADPPRVPRPVGGGKILGSGDARAAGRSAKGQRLQLAAQTPLRQVRHLLRRGGVLDQRLQHRPAGDAEHLADHAGQLDDSSSLSVRFCSVASASAKERRSRTRSRRSRMGGGGTKLGLTRLWRTSSAVHSASLTSDSRHGLDVMGVGDDQLELAFQDGVPSPKPRNIWQSI